MNFKELIDKRYTTKNYKSNQKINDKDLEKIIHAISYAPTSSNLQNGRVVIIKNKGTRERLSKFFMPQNRPRVTESSCLFVFIGISIDNMLRDNGKLIYEHAYKNSPLTEKEKRENTDTIIKFYESPIMKEAAKNVEVITCTTYYNFAMLQATELGYGTTTMLGYKSIELENDLKELKIINEGERLILTMSIGKELENDDVNKYSAIKKRADQNQIINIIE